MSILLRKVIRIADKPIPTEGYITVNCLSWFPNNILRVGDQKIELYEVSPYYLRDPASKCLFENVWHSSKWYPKVFEQKAVTKWDAEWNYPEEVHIECNKQGEEAPNAAYWQWRTMLAKHPYPVRYPNGRSGSHTCKGAIWSLDGKTLSLLSYFQARWYIYVQEYIKAVKLTSAFAALQALVKEGVKLELLDVDCPDTVEVTPTTFTHYLSQDKPRFGHTWALAAALLGFLEPQSVPSLMEVKGDLFTAGDDTSLAHCVSQDLAMGKGIAVTFKSKFDGVQELHDQQRKVGQVAWLQRDKRYIFYLITKQFYYGKPTYDTLQATLTELIELCKTKGVTKLAIPQLGCGLDRLDYPIVKAMVTKTFAGSGISITIYCYT